MAARDLETVKSTVGDAVAMKIDLAPVSRCDESVIALGSSKRIMPWRWNL